MLAIFMTEQPLLFIMLVSLLISLLTNIVTKYLTDQKEMKRLKEEISAIQKEMRAVQSKEPENAMKLQKKAMSLNFAYTKHTFKATFYTFIPLILLFGWLSFTLAYQPAVPGEQVSIDLFTAQPIEISVSEGLSLNSVGIAEVQRGFWLWKSTHEVTRINITPLEEGEHFIFVSEDECSSNISIISSRLITEKQDSSKLPKEPCTNSEISINYKPNRIFFLGINMRWIWVFIIFSMLFSTILKKALKVY
ncbi:MAG TPA: DUF106 domain-containing protein [Candidatus Woesearchaeota archaeon]|nr:DUF106 domain-containing protein [Candidatus Woesearchaeota archaeon]